MDRKAKPGQGYSYLMMIGHLCCDIHQSTVPALLPFLVAYRELGYTAAAGLVFAMGLASSFIQPLLGIAVDRKQMPWLMGLGIFMGGIGVASVGFLHSYWSIFAALIFAGLGAAIFHPEAGRMANFVAGEKKGAGVSTFIAGGNLAFVFGPVIAVFALSTWGLRGMAIFLIPSTIMSAIFLSKQKTFMQFAEMNKREASKQTVDTEQKDNWPAFCKLCLPILTRSVIMGGLSAFVPLYFVGVLMQTRQHGSLMLTVMACAGVVAAFVGGRIADRAGFARIMRLGFAVAVVLIAFLPQTRSVWIATALIVVLATSLNLGHGPSVALGQRFLPNRMGVASGIVLGLTVSMGGMFAPVLGSIGDNHGLTTVMYVMAGIAVIGLIGAMLVKEPEPLAKKIPTAVSSD